MREVTDLEDFRALVRDGRGYFVITDSANPNRIHDVRCSYVSVDNFRQKVVVNRRKNGRYYWISDPDDLDPRMGA